MKLSNKQIAERLIKVAENYPDIDFTNAKKELVLVIGKFKVRCLPDKCAILRVAKKYSEGVSELHCFKLPAKIKTYREPEKTILNRYKDDVDCDQFAIAFEQVNQ